MSDKPTVISQAHSNVENAQSLKVQIHETEMNNIMLGELKFESENKKTEAKLKALIANAKANMSRANANLLQAESVLIDFQEGE